MAIKLILNKEKYHQKFKDTYLQLEALVFFFQKHSVLFSFKALHQYTIHKKLKFLILPIKIE